VEDKPVDKRNALGEERENKPKGISKRDPLCRGPCPARRGEVLGSKKKRGGNKRRQELGGRLRYSTEGVTQVARDNCAGKRGDA